MHRARFKVKFRVKSKFVPFVLRSRPAHVLAHHRTNPSLCAGGCTVDPQDINSIYNVLELLQGRARSTEALVMVKLDIARNRILTAGLVFSMASTCLTVGALVSGIFGKPPPIVRPFTFPALCLCIGGNYRHHIVRIVSTSLAVPSYTRTNRAGADILRGHRVISNVCSSDVSLCWVA